MGYSLLFSLAIILFCARLLGELAAYFKIPSIFGELFAGILLGPSLLNWIQPTPTLQVLADLGLALLLFEIGFETNIRDLWNKLSQSTVVALGGIAIPFTLGFLLSHYYFALPLILSAFIGCTLTATSIDISLHIMRGLNKGHTHESHIVLGAAVINAIVSIITLGALVQFTANGHTDILQLGKEVIMVIFFVIVSPLIAWVIARVSQYFEKKSHVPGFLPIIFFSTILLYVWIAEIFHTPELLAGFAVGLAFSPHSLLSTAWKNDRFFHRFDTQMKPILQIFTPIFFVMIGLSVNLKSITWGSSFFWLLFSLLLVAAFLGKLASGVFLWKEKIYTRFAVGIAMLPIGEVGLIFAGIGKDKGIFNNEVYATLILIVTITTLCAPFALKFFHSAFAPKIK